MLILTRRIGETLVIGQVGDVLTEPVEVVILAHKGNQLRLGVKAPKEIRVDREEIRDRIDAGVEPGEDHPRAPRRFTLTKR